MSQDKNFASTLAAGIELLQCFSAERRSIRNSEFVEMTGMDKATVSRLTYTLMQLSYLRHDSQFGSYVLGPAVVSLGNSLLAGLQLRQQARAAMMVLARKVLGTVGIGLRHQADIVCVETVRVEGSPPPPVERGMPMPLIASAMGNAWLAAATPTERSHAANMIKTKYPRTYGRYFPRVNAAVREFAEKGYCSSSGFLNQEKFAVATPLRRRIDGELVIFNCVVEAGSRSKLRLGDRLRDAVADIQVAMGFDRE